MKFKRPRLTDSEAIRRIRDEIRLLERTGGTHQEIVGQIKVILSEAGFDPDLAPTKRKRA